jgi:hypothetical protein
VGTAFTTVASRNGSRISNESLTSALPVHSADTNCNVNDYQRKVKVTPNRSSSAVATNFLLRRRESPEHCKGRVLSLIVLQLHLFNIIRCTGKGFSNIMSYEALVSLLSLEGGCTILGSRGSGLDGELQSAFVEYVQIT